MLKCLSLAAMYIEFIYLVFVCLAVCVFYYICVVLCLLSAANLVSNIYE